jgi:hypothetical protein
MPDCEWLIRIVPLSLIASSESAGTVGLGVGKVAFQSLTICFQNSPCVSSGNCMPSKTFGYSGPKRKIAHAASWPAEKIGGIWSGGVLPSLTLLKVDGSVAERPRATWSIT